MKTVFKILSVIVLATIFTGCETFFDHEIPYFVETPNPVLVVNAELSPGKIAVVEVTNSSPIFANPPISITDQTNARVALYENGVLWDSLEYASYMVQGLTKYAFLSNKDIDANKNYSITANANGFSQVTSVTNVPSAIRPVSFEWLSFENRKANLRLKPLPQGQVYVITFEGPSGLIYYKSFNPILEFDEDDFFEVGIDNGGFYEGWIQSASMNGQEQDIQIEFVYGADSQVDVTLVLNIVEDDLFKYRQDLKGLDSDNPFNEPVQVHSNVNGGYGIFSAFANSETPIQ